MGLQTTLNVQYALGIELLGAHERDPRALDWMASTPAVGGCLGLWSGGDAPAVTDSRIEVVGEFGVGGGPPARLGAAAVLSEFPPAGLFALADGPAGDIVFVVPVRSTDRDWERWRRSAGSRPAPRPAAR